MLQLTTMDFEKRMIDLETKISFQDQTIEDLHDVIYKHQQQITQLQKAIENFQNQIKSDASLEFTDFINFYSQRRNNLKLKLKEVLNVRNVETNSESYL